MDGPRGLVFTGLHAKSVAPGIPLTVDYRICSRLSASLAAEGAVEHEAKPFAEGHHAPIMGLLGSARKMDHVASAKMGWERKSQRRSKFGGAAHRPRLESAGSVDGVKRGIRDSDAIGVLPTYAVADELSSGSLVELNVTESLPAIALRLTTLEPPPESSPLGELTAQIGEAFKQELTA